MLYLFIIILIAPRRLFNRSSHKVSDGNLAARISASGFLYFDTGVARRRNELSVTKSEHSNPPCTKTIPTITVTVFSFDSALAAIVLRCRAGFIIFWRAIWRQYRRDRERISPDTNLRSRGSPAISYDMQRPSERSLLYRSYSQEDPGLGRVGEIRRGLPGRLRDRGSHRDMRRSKPSRNVVEWIRLPDRNDVNGHYRSRQRADRNARSTRVPHVSSRERGWPEETQSAFKAAAASTSSAVASAMPSQGFPCGTYTCVQVLTRSLLFEPRMGETVRPRAA